MPAPIILVAAIVCNITHPLVVKAAVAIPDNEWQLLYVPMTAIDIGCAIFSHAPFSATLVKDIAPHAAKAIAALAKYSRPLAEVRNPIRGSNPWLLSSYAALHGNARAVRRPDVLYVAAAARLESPHAPAGGARDDQLRRQGKAVGKPRVCRLPARRLHGSGSVPHQSRVARQ